MILALLVAGEDTEEAGAEGVAACEDDSSDDKAEEGTESCEG